MSSRYQAVPQAPRRAVSITEVAIRMASIDGRFAGGSLGPTSKASCSPVIGHPKTRADPPLELIVVDRPGGDSLHRLYCLRPISITSR